MKWEDLIGQDKAKAKINFWLDSFAATSVMPHLLFVAPRGIGKTTLATSAGLKMKELYRDGEKKVSVINCASIKNLKQFWNAVVMPLLNDRNCTVLFDEASELPQDVTMALLTMINPNDNNRNSYTYDGYTIDIDFRRQSFMFATTEAQKLFHALKDRCNRIDLVDYNHDELAKIMKINAKGVKFESRELELEIASVLRANARQAAMMAKDIERYLATKSRDTFTKEDWQHLKTVLDINPLGLAPLEVRVLEVLNEQKDVSLTRLSATLGMTKESVQRDIELYLQRLGFFEVSTNGRNITPKGQEYIKALLTSRKKPVA